MKKFKTLKTIESFDNSKLSREQMYLANGGRRIIIIIGGSCSYSVCSQTDGNEPD